MWESNGIEFCQVTPMDADSTTYDTAGFQIYRNGSTFNLFLTDDDKVLYDKWRLAWHRVGVFTNFHQTYLAIRRIGQGVSSNVYIAEHRLTKKQFAVKQVQKDRLATRSKAKVRHTPTNSMSINRLH